MGLGKVECVWAEELFRKCGRLGWIQKTSAEGLPSRFVRALVGGMENDSATASEGPPVEGRNSNPQLFRATLRGVFTGIFGYVLLNLIWTVVDPPVSVLPETRENGYFDPIIFIRIIGIALVAIAMGGFEYWRVMRQGRKG
jgi:hypothetical protein